MNSMIGVVARQASLVAFKQKFPQVISSSFLKAVASQTSTFDKTRMLSTHYRHDNDSDVNYNDYEAQHFSRDFKEMRVATEAIEHSLDQLKETRAHHLKIVEGGGIPNANLEGLLEMSRNQEAVLSDQLQILKEHMVDANRALFAVDAPDGTSDLESKMDSAAVDEIINSASEHEDVDAVLQSHQEDREDQKRAMKIIAVTASDGISDDEMMVDKESIQNIIDYAAEHENAYTVLKEHQQDDEIREQNLKVISVDGPDGMSDDELEIDMEAVDNIITFASEHEDAQEVELRHQRERRDYVARMKRINDEHDW